MGAGTPVDGSPGEGFLRAAFAGDRGRLLAGLLLAEFAAALQAIAFSTVLPLASRELAGSGLISSAGPGRLFLLATVLFGGPISALVAGWLGWRWALAWSSSSGSCLLPEPSAQAGHCGIDVNENESPWQSW